MNYNTAEKFSFHLEAIFIWIRTSFLKIMSQTTEGSSQNDSKTEAITKIETKHGISNENMSFKAICDKLIAHQDPETHLSLLDHMFENYSASEILTWIVTINREFIYKTTLKYIHEMSIEKSLGSLEFFSKLIKNHTDTFRIPPKIWKYLPLVLDKIDSSETKISNGPGNIVGNCSQWVDSFVEHICSLEWHPEIMVDLVDCLKDRITTTKDQCYKIIEKLVSSFALVPNEQKPQLVYTLTLLSRMKSGSSCAGQGKNVLGLISDAINKWTSECEIRDEESIRNIYSVQALVVLRLSYAIKQDHEVATDFIKQMKAEPLLCFKSFNLPLLLVLSSINRFTDSVLDLLFNNVIASYKRAAKSLSFKWIECIIFNNL